MFSAQETWEKSDTSANKNVGGDSLSSGHSPGSDRALLRGSACAGNVDSLGRVVGLSNCCGNAESNSMSGGLLAAGRGGPDTAAKRLVERAVMSSKPGDTVHQFAHACRVDTLRGSSAGSAFLENTDTKDGV